MKSSVIDEGCIFFFCTNKVEISQFYYDSHLPQILENGGKYFEDWDMGPEYTRAYK